MKLTFVDFFAGSGLVTEALSSHFTPVWANDNCPKKADVYKANHGKKHFHLLSIVDQVKGRDVPVTPLSWASFPCQDLSLAGNMAGIKANRSGLVWEWLRVLDEQPARPPILVAENVVGLVSAHGGSQYRSLHCALVERGYRVGAVMLDAVHWVPQSRPRIFVIAVSADVDVSKFTVKGPKWCHTEAIIRCATDLNDWLWWKLPQPTSGSRPKLIDLLEPDAQVHDDVKAKHLIGLIPQRHKVQMETHLADLPSVFPGYRRTRGNSV